MKCKLVNENFRNDYVTNLLTARGVTDVDAYMHPSPAALQEPEALKNIGMAAALYLRIVLKDEPPYSRVLIIVDSDNDGYTSAAIMYQYTKLVNCHCQIDYWLHEGKQHGLQDHIDKLMTEDVSYDLIILPDSSSNDAHYHDMLDGINVPCLILDHHITDTPLSDNAVVVNNQLSPNYHNKELTGAGVVYQFCRFLDKKLGQNWADNFIDLAAWGIIGDMGSVLELENRYIINQGLSHINNSLLKAILEKQAYSITGNAGATLEEVERSLNAISVAFYVVPMINALIRVGTMDEKELLFKAFIDGDALVPCNKRGAQGTYEHAAIEAVRVATNARSRQNKIRDDALIRLENKIFKYNLLDNKILFVRLEEDDKFPPELNGLLAMQLAAKYKKPTIVARLNDQGYDRGSIRGLNNSPLLSFKDFLTGSGFFEYVQGHDNAAGASIPDKYLSDFHAYANAVLASIDFGENVYDTNFERTANELDISALITDITCHTDLWGQNNSEPIIHISHIPLTRSNIRIMGKGNDTVRVDVNGISYIKFKAEDFIKKLQDNPDISEMEIVGRANMNEYMGRKTPQILIEDYDFNCVKEFEF